MRGREMKRREFLAQFLVLFISVIISFVAASSIYLSVISFNAAGWPGVVLTLFTLFSIGFVSFVLGNDGKVIDKWLKKILGNDYKPDI